MSYMVNPFRVAPAVFSGPSFPLPFPTTLRDDFNATAGTTSVGTGNFNSAANSVAVLVFFTRSNTSTNITHNTPTSGHTNWGTVTLLGSEVSYNPTIDRYVRASAWAVKTSGSASSGQAVTFSASAGWSTASWWVGEWTEGFDPTAAIASLLAWFSANSDTGTTLDVDQGAAPDADAQLLGLAGQSSTSNTLDASFNELVDRYAGSALNSMVQLELGDGPQVTTFGTYQNDRPHVAAIVRLLQGAGRTGFRKPAIIGGASSGTVANTITSSIVKPRQDSVLFVVSEVYRTTGGVTFNTPTTTLANATIAAVGQDEGTNGSNKWIAIKVWRITFSGAPGAGTITQTITTTSTSRRIIVVETMGHNASTPIGQVANNNNATGTTLATTFGGAPNTTSLVFSALSQANTDTDMSGPSGFDELLDANWASVPHSYIAWKRTGATATGLTVTTTTSDQPKAMVSWEVQAA